MHNSTRSVALSHFGASFGSSAHIMRPFIPYVPPSLQPDRRSTNTRKSTSKSKPHPISKPRRPSSFSFSDGEESRQDRIHGQAHTTSSIDLSSNTFTKDIHGQELISCSHDPVIASQIASECGEEALQNCHSSKEGSDCDPPWSVLAASPSLRMPANGNFTGGCAAKSGTPPGTSDNITFAMSSGVESAGPAYTRIKTPTWYDHPHNCDIGYSVVTTEEAYSASGPTISMARTEESEPDDDYSTGPVEMAFKVGAATSQVNSRRDLGRHSSPLGGLNSPMLKAPYLTPKGSQQCPNSAKQLKMASRTPEDAALEPMSTQDLNLLDAGDPSAPFNVDTDEHVHSNHNSHLCVVDACPDANSCIYDNLDKTVYSEQYVGKAIDNALSGLARPSSPPRQRQDQQHRIEGRSCPPEPARCCDDQPSADEMAGSEVDFSPMRGPAATEQRRLSEFTPLQSRSSWAPPSRARSTYQLIDISQFQVPLGASLTMAVVYSKDGATDFSGSSLETLGQNLCGRQGGLLRAFRLKEPDTWLLVGYRCSSPKTTASTDEQTKSWHKLAVSRHDGSRNAEDGFSCDRESDGGSEEVVVDNRRSARVSLRDGHPSHSKATAKHAKSKQAWSESDDYRLLALKGQMKMSWHEIYQRFPNRSEGAVYARWYYIRGTSHRYNKQSASRRHKKRDTSC